MYFVEIAPDNFQKKELELISELTKNKSSGVIISVTRPGKNIIRTLENNDINTEKLRIVDCISKTQDSKIENTDKIVYVENASSLTDISIKINEVLNGLEPPIFLIMDSINSMMIHTDEMPLKRFIHGLLTKLRLKDVSGYLLSSKGNLDKDMRAEITQLCDRVTEI